MLLGRFENKLDQKNRIFVPAKFREIIGNDFVMSFDDEKNCIKCMTTENFIHLYNACNNSEDDIYLEKGLRAQRLIRNSNTATIDNQGRTTIPQQWLESMSASGTALIIGMVNYFEIWGAEDYDKDNSELNKSIKLADKAKRSAKTAKAMQDLAQAQAIIKENEKLIED